MHDKNDKIIYVGKAVSLKNRVRQYFRKTNKTKRIENMVALIDHFEYIVTDNEAEALILECNLIKKNMPKFNVLLKDDKTYPYIKVNIKADYPDVYITRRILNDGAKYFGPYANAGSAKEMVDFIKTKFKIRQCKTFKYKDRPCLNYHIKKCLAPCMGYISKEEYMEQQHMLVSDRVFSYVSIYLFVILNRKINKKRRTVEKLTGDTASDNLLNWFADKYEVSINKNDVKDFGRYMKQHDFNISSEQKEINDVELYGIIVYFLQMVGEDIECSLQSDTVLIESLLEHIRTLKNWEDYDFEMPLSDELPIPKEILEKTIEKNSIILERYLGYPLTKEMKESIMIHICAAFVRNLEYLNLLEVLIVCPGSMATGKYLEAQVKNYFDFRVAAVIPSRDVEEFLKSNKIDFVISTVNVRSESVPCVKVQAQLTMNDINAIQNIAFLLGRKENKSENRYVEQNFLDVMKTFLEKLDASKRDEFFDEVYALMETKIQSTGKSILAQMLDPSKIMIKQEKITWEQGILQAADILEKKGCVGSDYGKKAVENVKEYGDYIIISKGIALAHAGKKEAHVYKDGLSLVMCPEGIEFTEGNIVYLVFCFAVAEEKDYLKLFQEIIALGKTQKKMKDILQQKNVVSLYHSLVF